MLLQPLAMSAALHQHQHHLTILAPQQSLLGLLVVLPVLPQLQRWYLADQPALPPARC